MPNGGITAQYGFEYQKMVFIYQALQINPNSQISYENRDDVDIAKNNKNIYAMYSPGIDRIFQVKSGNIDKATLKKIFMNWLLDYRDNVGYACFIENPLTIEYSADQFKEELINEIKTTNKRGNSIIKQVKTKYIDMNKEDELSTNLQDIILNCEFNLLTIEEIEERSFAQFKNNYLIDEIELINEERFEEFLKIIYYKTSMSMVEKKPFVLIYRDLQEVVQDVATRINESKYDISFTNYKENNSNLKKLNLNSSAAKQLRLVKEVECKSKFSCRLGRMG